jgi:peptidoglycan/LPS O-acetylase OafA/YrhL
MGQVVNTVQPKEVVKQGRLQLAYLDGLRAVCALFVVAYHAYLAVFIQSSPTGIITLVSHPTSYGHLAVPIFIVISGFCLMLPIITNDGVLRGGARQFFYKRARRILPPYYSAMILFILGRYFIERETILINDIITHSLLIHNFFPEYIRSKSVNPSFWSIAIEWQIYFLFPILLTAASTAKL